VQIKYQSSKSLERLETVDGGLWGWFGEWSLISLGVDLIIVSICSVGSEVVKGEAECLIPSKEQPQFVSQTLQADFGNVVKDPAVFR
jgi:hypothetical protein